MSKKNKVKMTFGVDTTSWLIWKAVCETNDNVVGEKYKFGQALRGDRVVFDLEEINNEMRNETVVDEVDKGVVKGKSAKDFVLSKEDFSELKDKVKEAGKVVEETEKRLVLEGED